MDGMWKTWSKNYDLTHKYWRKILILNLNARKAEVYLWLKLRTIKLRQPLRSMFLVEWHVVAAMQLAHPHSNTR